MSWTAANTPSTSTANNASRFISMREQSRQLKFTSSNPFVVVSTDPRSFTSLTDFTTEEWTSPVDDTQTSNRSLGNWNRMIQSAAYVESGQRGVDFSEVVSATSPWSVTTLGAIEITIPRENPV